MEVLLLEDIPGIGQKNDICVVKEGFALNNLLPRRRALVATPTVRRRYAEVIRRRAVEKAHEAELMKSAAGVLLDAVVMFTRKASKNGKLYAAVTELQISEALNEQFQVEAPEAAITLTEQIKTVGSHTAIVKLGEKESEVKIEVKAEEE